jgi:anti-sigma factor RsiW
MTCRELSDFLADYVAGELPHEVSAEFDGHLGRCPECHLFLEQYRITVHLCCEAYDDTIPPSLPEDLVHAILASLAKTASSDR